MKKVAKKKVGKVVKTKIKKMAKKVPKKVLKKPAAKNKIEKVMREFKEGALHSGSEKGPKVRSRKQAVAIALSEARKKKKK